MSGQLECNLLDATGLRDTQLLGRQDVYVIFQVGTVRQQSKVKKDGGTKPAWNQRIPLGVFQAAAAPQMLVEVFATSALGKDDHLGGVVVDLTRVQRSGMEDVKAALRTRDNRPAGQVQLILKWIPVDGFGPGKPQAGAAAWPFAGAAPSGGYAPPAAPGSQYPPPVGGGYPAPAVASASYPPPATHGSGGYPPAAAAASHYPPPASAAAPSAPAAPAPAPSGYPPAVPPSHVAPPQQPVMHAAAAPPQAYGAAPAGYYAPAPYAQPYPPAPGYTAYPAQYPPASHHTTAMAAMGGMMAGAATGAYPTYAGGYHYGKHKYKGMKYKHKRFKGMKGFKWK